MGLPIWSDLDRAVNDGTKIDEAIENAIIAHNDDPESHLGADQSLQSHRASEIIDHLVESVVNDKLATRARRYVAIVDPDSDVDFDTLESAIAYAFQKGGGDIYIVRGTHYLADTVNIAPTIGLYGDGMGETIIRSSDGSTKYLNMVNYANDGGGAMLLDTPNDGDTIIPWDFEADPDYNPVVGMFLNYESDDVYFSRITAVDPDAGEFTIADAITGVSSEIEAFIIAGVHLTNGSSDADHYTGNPGFATTYFPGMSIVRADNAATYKTVGAIDENTLQLESAFTGTTGDYPAYMNYQGYSTMNVQGITFGAGLRNIQMTGGNQHTNAYVESCEDFYFIDNNNKGVYSIYSGCLFNCTTSSMPSMTTQVKFEYCTFLATANGSQGLRIGTGMIMLSCLFKANSYTNHTWLFGRNESCLITGCTFESIKGETVFNSSGSGNPPGPTIAGNYFYLQNNNTLTFQIKNAKITNNYFETSGTGKVDFNSGSINNIVALNQVKATITNSGTNNSLVSNLTV